MRFCLLVLAALAASVGADTGTPVMTCPDGWHLFDSLHETSCMKLMSEPLLFEAAFKACIDHKAMLLTFTHRNEKVHFINSLILNSSSHASEISTWTFDPTFMHRDLPNTRGRGKARVTDPRKPGEMHEPRMWMVINPNKDPHQIKLEINDTVVARNYICEKAAHPAAQRPQFQIEPEHLFISDILVNSVAKTAEGESNTHATETKPFIVTFNCLAYGVPKPTVEWHQIYKSDNGSLISEPIRAKVTTDPHEPLKYSSTNATAFYNLQRDCKLHHCPPDSIEERSQLVIINPQFMSLNKSIACMAKNEFGSVISQEAKFFVTKMNEFAVVHKNVTVQAGVSAIINNAITAEPDTAAAECYRIGKDKEPISIEHFNRMLHGGIQMSKATFDIIVDLVEPASTGEYLCRARMHNGRLGHVVRQKTINLTVEACEKEKGCDLDTKPVAVAEGYPAVLSLNPLSNKYIRYHGDFSLDCPCTGKRKLNEDLKVEWNLNNNTHIKALEIPVLPRFSSLLIQGAKPETHTGKYSCRCVRGEEKSDWRHIDIEILPLLEPANHKDVITVKAGEMANFGCHVNAEMPGLGVFVEPLRNVETLSDYLSREGNERIKVHRDGPSHYNIAIDNVKETDAGVYGCRVTVNYFNKWISHDTFYSTLIVEKIAA